MIVEFKQLAATVAASLAAAGATVVALDFFLSKSQKAWVENTSLALWYWLSQKNASATIEWYKTNFMFEAILKYTLFSLGIALVILSPVLGPNALGNGITYIFLGAINAGVVTAILKIEPIYDTSYRFYNGILSHKHPLVLFTLSTLLQLCWLIVWYIFVLLLHAIVGKFVSDEAFSFMLLAVTIFIVPICSSYLAICTLSTQFLLIYVISLNYSFLEWFVRKSAESDKGTVLGASAALGAISGFIKNFT